MAATITAYTIQHFGASNIILALKVNEYNIYCPIQFMSFCVAHFYCPYSCNKSIIQTADVMNINVRPTVAVAPEAFQDWYGENHPMSRPDDGGTEGPERGAKQRSAEGVGSGEGCRSPSPVQGSGCYAPRIFFYISKLKLHIFKDFCKLKIEWSHLQCRQGTYDQALHTKLISTYMDR